MKLAIIGTGLIVKEFLPELSQMDDLELVAVLGTQRSFETTKLLCTQYHIPNAFCDFEDLCLLDIDTVYIAVPNYLHFDYCKKSLEHGWNVIVEKPITSNITEARELEKLALNKNLFLFEAVTTLHFDAFRKVKEWLPRIGTIRMVKCNYSQYSRRYDAFQKGEILPVFDPEKSGGALMDLNLYNLQFVIGMFGKPRNAVYFANIERGIDTNGTMILQYDGFIADCTAAKDCAAPGTLVLQGTNGYITANYPPNLLGKVTVHQNDGKEDTFEDPMVNHRVVPEFKDFITCIRNNDFNSCHNWLKISLDVSHVQTQARLNAGIVFAADRLNQN